MDNDDRPIGRVLSRREALAVMGALSAAALAACSPVATAATQAATAATQAPTPLVQRVPRPTPAATTGVATSAATAAAKIGATTSAAATPMCVVRPALTEGPYFVDEKLNRSDIRTDPSDGSVKDGLPLHLVFRVSRLDGISCAAFPGVTVDVWHCDAQGVYSDVQDPSFNTKGKKY